MPSQNLDLFTLAHSSKLIKRLLQTHHHSLALSGRGSVFFFRVTFQAKNLGNQITSKNTWRCELWIHQRKSLAFPANCQSLKQAASTTER